MSLLKGSQIYKKETKTKNNSEGFFASLYTKCTWLKHAPLTGLTISHTTNARVCADLGGWAQNFPMKINVTRAHPNIIFAFPKTRKTI